MKHTDIPKKHPIPFANAGDKNTIPQTGGAAGAATLTDGFPPETMVPVIAGGIPPDGKDMNGVLFELSDMGRWANAGAEYTFDQGFCTAIGGYPAGARLLSSDGKSVFISEVDDNTANPEAVSDKWVGFSNYRGAITATTGVHTLTALEASRDLIVVSGTLTGNVQLVFPAWVKHWQIINSTTGNFSLTCKTASGSGVIVKSGFLTDIYGDGTSISSHANTDVAGVVRTVNDHGPDTAGNVKLGTAADADVQTSVADLTVGRVLTVGKSYGLGPSGVGRELLSVLRSTSGYTGFTWSQNTDSEAPPFFGASQSFGIQNHIWHQGSDNYALQTVWRDGKIGFRTVEANTVGPWCEYFHTKNPPTATQTGALPLTGGTMTGPLGINNADFINKVGYATYTGGDGHNHAQVGGLRLEVDSNQMAEFYYDVDTTSQSAEVSLHNKYGTTDSHLSLRNDGQLAIVGSWPAITTNTGTTWHPDGNIQGPCWEGDYLSNWLLTKVMPVGAALPWPQETPPPGWLLCNGSGFDINACPRLAAIFPNGILPDYRGAFLRGKDNGKGVDPNRELLSTQPGQAPASAIGGGEWGDYAGRDTGHTVGTGSDNTYTYRVMQETEQQRETRPYNVAINYIVRAA